MVRPFRTRGFEMTNNDERLVQTQNVSKLEIFISYASEDVGLAIALQKTLCEHLDQDLDRCARN